jgi:uncharacterized protein
MNCVACDKPMVVLELGGVEIDHCLACGGIWLDSGELELLASSEPQSGRLLAQIADIQKGQPGSRKCPICLKKMDAVILGVDVPVQIDRCRENHGLWFDRAELRLILKYLHSNNQSAIHGLLQRIFETKT